MSKRSAEDLQYSHSKTRLLGSSQEIDDLKEAASRAKQDADQAKQDVARLQQRVDELEGQLREQELGFETILKEKDKTYEDELDALMNNEGSGVKELAARLHQTADQLRVQLREKELEHENTLKEKEKEYEDELDVLMNNEASVVKKLREDLEERSNALDQTQSALKWERHEHRRSKNAHKTEHITFVQTLGILQANLQALQAEHDATKECLKQFQDKQAKAAEPVDSPGLNTEVLAAGTIPHSDPLPLQNSPAPTVPAPTGPPAATAMAQSNAEEPAVGTTPHTEPLPLQSSPDPTVPTPTGPSVAIPMPPTWLEAAVKYIAIDSETSYTDFVKIWAAAESLANPTRTGMGKRPPFEEIKDFANRGIDKRYFEIPVVTQQLALRFPGAFLAWWHCLQPKRAPDNQHRLPPPQSLSYGDLKELDRWGKNGWVLIFVALKWWWLGIGKLDELEQLAAKEQWRVVVEETKTTFQYIKTISRFLRPV
ncbi:hypothetical protein PQX77_009737 [Marasmius sp. AFHP31]|nr:hypothetical protein PQX77_009737 [Marasmius sp. AFHP31]